MINIPGLIPDEDLDCPAGATHAKITGGWVRIDFGTGLAELVSSNQVVLSLNGAANNVVLTPLALPSGAGTDIFILQIVSYQEINGVKYVLKNGEFNGMGVVGLV